MDVASGRDDESNVDQDEGGPRSHEHGAAAKTIHYSRPDDGRDAGEGGEAGVDSSLLLGSGDSDQGEDLSVVDRDNAAGGKCQLL